MVEWLENGEGKPDDIDVWGVEKSNYTFKDLIDYLEQTKEKGKGKKKKVADKKEKGEKKSHKKQVK